MNDAASNDCGSIAVRLLDELANALVVDDQKSSARFAALLARFVGPFRPLRFSDRFADVDAFMKARAFAGPSFTAIYLRVRGSFLRRCLPAQCQPGLLQAESQ
jgi:hypothetical protein